jgi:DNA-binding response OmpR family regulator
VIAHPVTISQRKRNGVSGDRAPAARWTFRVLIVTPHLAQRQELERALQEVGYETRSLEQAQHMAAFLHHEPCDAIILDLDQLEANQAENTLHAFRDLQSQGVKLPTMVLGSASGLEQRIAAFDAGGDDFQIKPLIKEELFVRLRSILRRTNPHLALNLEWRGLYMNWALRTASVDGRSLPLNLNEFALFEVLAAVPGRVISSSDLKSHLEGASEEHVNEVILDLHSKLGMTVIETVSGEGYRFPPGD